MNQPLIPRDLLALAFPGQPRLVAAFEEQSILVNETSSATATATAATDAMRDATVLTLSPNAEFSNERVVTAGAGIRITDENGRATFSTGDDVPLVDGGFRVMFQAQGDCSLALPLAGLLATVSNPETLSNKTLAKPKVSGIGDYPDDGAAAAAGVPVGGTYRTGSTLKVRVA